jgi:cellulose synthase/poly-beta-1,6-N-acetylglucosamine synthase-like glycosyltransferase
MSGYPQMRQLVAAGSTSQAHLVQSDDEEYDEPPSGSQTPRTPYSTGGHSVLSHGAPLTELDGEASQLGFGPASTSYHSSGSRSQSHSTPGSNQEKVSLQRQDAYLIMAETLFRTGQRERLFSDNPAIWNGVALRLEKNRYVSCPSADPRLVPWLQSLCLLNCEASISMTSTVVAGICSTLPRFATEVVLTTVDRVQVVESIEELATCRKAQGACFVRKENRLIIFADKVHDLMPATRNMEAKMVKYVWERATGQAAPALGNMSSSASTKARSLNEKGEEIEDGHMTPDLEDGADIPERSTNLQAPLAHGLALGLNCLIISLMLRTLIMESLVDGNWMRMVIFSAAPFLFPITLFFCDNIIQNIFLVIAPIRHMSLNSRYYSGVAPRRITGVLPHVTIQMPVYKESLESVLIPTIESLKAAISTYELQGGTAEILVSEDGLQVVDEVERAARLDYYDRNQIAWVARPPHNSDGYMRAGRFKKASNLNFTCEISLAVERMLTEERPVDADTLESWSYADEASFYQWCLERAVQETHPKAEAAGNVRIGELILIIDCDTRVPEDCFLDAVSELHQSPDVAILQHCSGVMLVTKDNYFERCIGFFTRCINFAISYTVAAGDVAPFMGHNAFLRWSAIQEAAFIDPADGKRKVWCETTVSEDFDLSLRVLLKGYITRWATYSNNGFEEGVSLTAEDELNRWQKYAFGCSELVFKPIWKWYKGPLTGIYSRYMWSSAVPTHAKCSASSYIFSYYAIASALPISILSYCLSGWLLPELDLAYLPSWNVLFAVLIVFSAAGNLATIIAKFRATRQGLLEAFFEHIVWLPALCVFFSGISYSVLMAIFAHPLGINMTWGSTLKDLEESNFFVEVPGIFRRQWRPFLLCGSVIAGVIVCTTSAVPLIWRVTDPLIIFPCVWACAMHILYPIALNPALLRFSF